MNEKILQKYMAYLRGKYRKKMTAKNYHYFTKRCLQWINKPLEKMTRDDMMRWREYIINRYMPNGNFRRVSSVNHFLTWAEREDLKIPAPKQEMSNKIIMSEKELEKYLEASKDNPLWHMVALLQIDGILRPGEFRNIKLQNIDFEDLKLYLDDTKTGNNYVIMSQRLAKAIEDYMPYRNALPQYKDYLITVPKGRYKGRRLGEQVMLIKNITKRIAAKAGIKKKVTPYIVKPSVITNDFNRNINPKIIQRKARHRNIESTLRYDHTDDKMVREHFQKMDKPDITKLPDKYKTKLMLDHFLNGEIDITTFKRSLDLIYEKDRKPEDMGYA